MPSGYTHEVQTGEVTEFSTFLLQCSRAFGALVSMRDAADNAPIPDEIKPNTDYYDESIKSSLVDIVRLIRMPEADKVAGAAKQFENRILYLGQQVVKDIESRDRYEAMLVKVRAWTPPTPDHVNLKEFMIKQLEDSIEWDCKTDYESYYSTERQTPHQWWTTKLKDAVRELERSIKSRDEEITRATEKTTWIRALRESIQ